MPVIHSNFGVVVAMFCVLPLACLPQAGCAARSAKVAVRSPASDAEIVDMLLTHNEVAVGIVALCRERAVRADLKEYCSTGAPDWPLSVSSLFSGGNRRATSCPSTMISTTRSCAE